MLVDWGISIRRACKVLRFDTSTYHYKSRRTGQAPLERRIKEICETRVRYGYRRVHVHLRRDGWKINMKKTRRIYSELGLQLRNKHPKQSTLSLGQSTRFRRAVVLQPPSPRLDSLWIIDMKQPSTRLPQHRFRWS